MNCESWTRLCDWKAGRPEMRKEVSQRLAASTVCLPIWCKNERLGEIFRLSFISFSQYSCAIVSISILYKKRILHFFGNTCSILKSYPTEVQAESFAKRSQILVSVVVSSKRGTSAYQLQVHL